MAFLSFSEKHSTATESPRWANSQILSRRAERKGVRGLMTGSCFSVCFSLRCPAAALELHGTAIPRIKAMSTLKQWEAPVSLHPLCPHLLSLSYENLGHCPLTKGIDSHPAISTAALTLMRSCSGWSSVKGAQWGGSTQQMATGLPIINRVC